MLNKIPVRFSDFTAGHKTNIFRDARDVFEHLETSRRFPVVTFSTWQTECERLFAQLQKAAIHLAAPFTFDYPQVFYALDEPPLAWTYQGAPLWTTTPLLAVVGSRRPASETLSWLDLHLTSFCQSQKWAILSGGARGVDQRAHLIALKTGSPTIAILPSGLNRLYPRDFYKWKQPILANGGTLATAYAPFEEMQKYHFLSRNRLIVALSRGVFVVEANRRSGSRMTAQWAMEQNKDLATLPLSAMSEQGLGNLDLIHDGAQLLRDMTDLKLWCASLPTVQN